MDRQPAYASFGVPNGNPNSKLAAEQVLSLPMSADLSEAQQHRVIQALRDALR